MAAKDQTAGTLGRAPSGRTPVRPGQTGADAPKKRTSPGQFAKEVRAEARKITWTSRRETWITSVMVFIMVILAAIFLQLIDLGLGFSMLFLLQAIAG